MQCSNDTLIPSSDHEESDIALMLRIRGSDDAEAFALLAARYQTSLKRFFAALLPDASHADDFAQETLLRLWQSRNRYEATGKFSAYLFKIGRNYYLNQRLRYRERIVQEVSSESTSGVEILSASPHTQPEIILLERLSTARLQRHIAELPPIYREVFLLSHIDGLKYAEIAERLGIPIGTVKSRMAEAVRRLRAEIPREEL